MGGSFSPGLLKAGGPAEMASVGPPTPDERPSGLLGWGPLPLSPEGSPEPSLRSLAAVGMRDKADMSALL